MPNDIVISVENLTKEYRLGIINHGTLYQDVQSWWARLRGKEDPNSLISAQHSINNSDGDAHFLALKDVSFEVKQGEVLGIIGRNGAGKSTLLKILSKVTAPTSGIIRIKGRVASLLEVGTGFHPELTGRENIFLNGAILGMTKTEIQEKFDEIVAFAEIEKFIDTPVKRYSSGMYVRLAFAVAAHLEPEILIVDEVLAVGDAQFQKKCIGKMGDVAKGGRTVLFVSHNMAAVENLCNYGIVLEKGGIVFKGEVSGAINSYLKSFSNDTEQDLSKRNDRKGEGNIKITKIEVVNQLGEKNIPFPIGSNLRFLINYKAKSVVKNPRVIIGVYDLMSLGIARFDTEITTDLPSSLPESGQINCSTEMINLVPGRYVINIAFFSNGTMEDYIAGAAILDIIDSDYFGTGKSFNANDSRLVRVLFKHKWEAA
ncbi:MAG: ABC transporter ATP-binding protein [Nitrospirae bacterium]|nr:ABC transporter ATP-binding protein [Nitrospirota bacterium]